jgi:hypothetical protein
MPGSTRAGRREQSKDASLRSPTWPDLMGAPESESLQLPNPWRKWCAPGDSGNSVCQHRTFSHGIDSSWDGQALLLWGLGRVLLCPPYEEAN